MQPQLVGDLGEGVPAQVHHLAQRKAPLHRGQRGAGRRRPALGLEKSAVASEPAWVGERVPEEFSERLGGRAVPLGHQLLGQDGRVGEVNGMASFVEQGLVVVQAAHRLHRHAHVFRRIHRLDESPRELLRVQAVVHAHVGARGSAQIEPDAAQEHLERPELQLPVEEAREPRRLPEAVQVRNPQLLARRVQLLAGDPIERGAEDRVGRLHVGDSRHQQRVEFDVAQLLGELDVVGETGLAGRLLRRLLPAHQDGIQLLHPHRVHGGECLPTPVRVFLLSDQVLQIAVRHRLVLPRQGDGRRRLDVRVLVAEARGREPDDLGGQRAPDETKGERVVLRHPGLLLRGGHRVQGRLLEETVVSDVRELLQRDLALCSGIPAEHGLDAPHGLELLAERLHVSRIPAELLRSWMERGLLVQLALRRGRRLAGGEQEGKGNRCAHAPAR